MHLPADTTTDAERRNLLSICRSVMPGVAGVLLSTAEGRLLAHEDHCDEPHALAHAAAQQRHPAGMSTLLSRESGLYLVVFVPQPLAEQWSPAAPIPA